ncbi:MAG: DUF1631 domain-containing protein [Usitatibacter sp.]
MTQNGNVVPLGSHPRAKSRLSSQESASVLTGCREMALDRIAGALSGMLDRVEDELFELAEKSLDRDEQNVFLDARSAARAKRSAIESTFRQHFVEFFNRKVRGDASSLTTAPQPGELSLVGHEALEESLALNAMSNRLTGACEGELFALSQRMGFLMERPEMEDDANPMSPATICAALKDACDQIESDFRVRMALLRQLERHAQVAVQSVYQDINAHLVARHILPDVRPTTRRAGAAQASASKRAAASPNEGKASSASATPDLFGTLAQLLGSSNAGGGGVGGGGGGAGGDSIAGLLGGHAMAGGGGGGGMAASPFMAELTRMHRDAPSGGTGATEEGLVNILKSLKSVPQGASLGTVDAMTIDIVAMLFDYVFDDDHIPASVKALLGRLQIPTLKVALLDKSFFSSRAHPARHLIDLLAAVSIGLDDNDKRGSATLKMIEGVVDEVLSKFDTDLALFEHMVARVEEFIAEEGRAEADVVQRSSQLIEERERAGISRLVAEEQVLRSLQSRVWVPAVLREMLLDTWVGALASVQLAEGEGSPAWQALVQTMDDLLWSVEPKACADDRKRLVVMLPGMLKRIQQGLTRGEMTDGARDTFLGALVDSHAAAVKAGLRGLAALPEPVAPPPAPIEEIKVEREILPAGDIQVEEIRLRKPAPGAAIVRNVFTRTGIWTNLQRGTWCEFVRDNNTPLRARLTWISPNKGVYLFTNSMSRSNAVSITPEALAEQMRLGLARVIDDTALVDRAVDSMVENLRKTAA